MTMQNRQERRVRRLRLAAASENELRCGVALIKDAFHVASLPARADSLFLIIRSLQMGRFSVNCSSAYLATIIEHKLQEIASQAVRGDHPNANSYPAVYFLDELEPYIALAARIARGDDTSAWFWPLAVQGWQPRMSPAEAMRAVFFRVVAEADVVGVARLVRDLRERDLIDRLLLTLKVDDAEQLMRMWGWPAPTPLAESSVPQFALDREVCAGARHTLARWLSRWGSSDARSTWLAAILLIGEKPARLLDRQLLSRAVRLIEISETSRSIASSNRAPLSRESREYFRTGSSANFSLSKADASESRETLAATNAGSLLPNEIDGAQTLNTLRELPSSVAPSWFGSAPRSENLASTNSQDFLSDSLEPLRKNHDDRSFPSNTAAPSFQSTRNMIEIARVAANLQSSKADTTTPNRSTPETPTISSSNAVEPRLTVVPAHVETKHQVSTWTSASIHSEEVSDPLAVSASESSRTGFLLQVDAAPTEFGGFFFLLAVISRLGIANFLEHNTHFIDLDVTAHLLRFLSAQLNIPRSDPASSWLNNAEESLPDMIEFSLPPVWRRLYRSKVLLVSRINGEPGYRVLKERSGKIVLSSWRGPIPPAVRELIGNGRIRRITSDRNENVTSALFNTWHRAIRRWCRSYAGLRLPELISRRALITSTRTHIDLYFDVNKADIRVRRAGLDLDPGWVPWLGRVISFHYREEGEIDGL